jgi:tetratricopeptide (TPR) repeat protein
VKARVLTLVCGFLLGALTMLVGLAQAGKLAPSRPDALVALAQTVEVEHRRIDLLLERGNVAGAIGLLEQLRKQPWLSRDEGGDVAVELRHDVYGRLVRLRLDYPDVDPQSDDALLQLIAEGLGDDYRAIDTNPFTARLVALRGEIFETLDRDDEALGAYEEALDMNRTLLERELGSEP